MGKFLVIGHRGAAGHEPENTVRSVRRAIELGVDWIEIDVHRVEQELLVFHDRRLERTTNGKGELSAQSVVDLRTLDAGKGEKIPLLDEIFDAVDRRAGVNIEIKGRDTARTVAEFCRRQLQRGWKSEELLVSSFDHRQLEEFVRQAPEIPCGVLFDGVPLDPFATTGVLRAVSIHYSLGCVAPDLIDDAHARGLRVYVYTVNYPEDIRRMIDWGADGVFSNYPERAIAARGR